LEIKQWEEKRKVYPPNIEPRLLAQYEKILKSREGLAVAPVQHNACGGCHLGLPPQIVNEIHLSDKVIVCESCARILYWVS
jgi:predicted  nucleic acid-binding Zn-ribbon protein